MISNKLQKKNFWSLSILTLLFIFVCVAIASVSVLARKYGIKYRKDIERIANEVGIESNLVMAICKTESSFRSSVVSKANAIGLMQILPSTAEWVCEQNGLDYSYEKLFDYEFNAKVGCFYLKYLQNKFPFEWAIVAYNAGENKVSEWIDRGLDVDEIPYKESREYLKKVLANRKYYNFLFN